MMILLLLSLLLTWTPVIGAQPDIHMPFMEHLDVDNNVILKWGFREVQGTITFQLTFKTTGFVGFGFSPNGDMAGADIVIGGVGPKANYFKDSSLKLIYAYGKTDDIGYHGKSRGTKEVNLLNMPSSSPLVSNSGASPPRAIEKCQ
ncbi:hypothetical protein J4Q44_G00230190 [Coregonus suidteri]|uniref:DOMON domain-containing protein n=1 Tax=Coregonus suidteri TaxID=861788 RepID=A0AAN8QHI4_9TELE